MIKNYFQRNQFEWPFIFLFAYISLQCFYHFDYWMLLPLIAVLLRIVTLRNWNLLLTAVVLIIIILIRANSNLTNLHQVEQLPIDGKQMHAMLYTEPFDVSSDDQAIRGQGKLKIVIDNDIMTFKVDYSKWLEEFEGVDRQLLTESSISYVSGTMNSPPPARNFYVFDYKDYLKTQDIVWQFEIDEIINTTKNNSLTAQLANVRYNLLSNFIKLNGYEWIAIHNKLLLNIDSDHYKSYQDNFISLGVAHFFSISGFHIYFIRRLIQNVLLRIGVTVERTQVFISIFLLFYVWLIGWPVGVIRVLLMGAIRDVLHKYQISMSRLDILASSGLILLVYNPMNTLSLGYTLSYFMTAVVIMYNQSAFLKNAAIQSFEMTVACLLLSWPIIIQASFEWNIVQLFVVVVFSVFFNQFIMPAMFLTSIGIILSPPGFFQVVEQLSELMSAFNSFMNESSLVGYLNRIMGRQSSIVFYLLLLTALFYLYFIHIHPYVAYAIPILVYSLFVSCLPYLNPATTFTMLDVAQGDALLIQMSHNRGDWLIDTGGRRLWEEENGSNIDKSFAERNIIPALKALGVHRLDGVIITHPDLDHIGNLAALSQEVEIEELWVSKFTLESDIWTEIAPELKADVVVGLELGRRYAHKELPITVYSAPYQAIKYSSSVSNDSSLIVQFELGDLSLLMLGDITSQIEEVILRSFPEIKGDILKLGHHGSDTSTSEQLLSHTLPRLGLISAGVENQYGHPHLDVIERLETMNIPYLSTNEEGAVQISYDPIKGYQIHTVIQP